MLSGSGGGAVHSAAMPVVLALALLSVDPALSADYYVHTAPNGTVTLSNVRRSDDYELWWSDTVPRKSLPNGVPMPRLDRIANLDAYDHLFRAEASRTGLPAELLKAVCVAESRMNPVAVSSAGAQGLMQIMPGTQPEVGVRDPFDPAQSVAGGALYLQRMHKRFGTYELALAAYNAGPGSVERAGGVPNNGETPVYVSRVLGLYQHFRDSRPLAR
jgi:soluble lytic murein transglycosylase-like protein